MRPSGRQAHELRNISFVRNYTKHAEGSVLVSAGDTKVLCTASVLANSVPRFLKGSNQGWLSAEYSMLPRATHERTEREAARGKQSGRTQEIQRLIGRSLRACLNLAELGEHTIMIDCDVIQADGGTRTAAINGACIALKDALQSMYHKKIVRKILQHKFIAAVSVGIYSGQAVVDLDYQEDSKASTDMNIVMDEAGNFIEIQGTAEKAPFSQSELNTMIELAQAGTKELFEIQRKAIAG